MTIKELRPGFPTGLVSLKRSDFAEGIDTTGILNTGIVEHGPDATMTVPTNTFGDDHAVPSALRYNEDTDDFEGAYSDGWRALGGAGTRWVAPDASTSISAEKSRGYLVDNRTMLSALILPTPSKVGDTVSTADLYGAFSNYPLTVKGGGHNIYGAVDDLVINTSFCVATFTWTGDVQGWIITQAVGLGQGLVYNRVLLEQDLTVNTTVITLDYPALTTDVYYGGLRIDSNKYQNSDDGKTITFTPALVSGSHLTVVEYTPVTITDNAFGDLEDKVGITANKEAIARKFGVKTSEVSYAIAGSSLSGVRVVYDTVSQRSYMIPTGIASGSSVTSLTDGILVYSSGSTDLGALAAARNEYVTLGDTFNSGFTLRVKNEIVSDGTYVYRWDGSLSTPKVVAAGSTPISTGGISAGAWVNVSVTSNTQCYFETVMSTISLQLKNGGLYTFKGRSNPNDGGGGVFRYDSASTDTADNGIIFAVSGGGRLIRQVRTSLSENQISEAINVRWFGAKGDAANDDTAAVLAAYNYAVSTTLFYTLLFPAGRYVTLTSFVFTDVTQGSFLMEGALFIGGSTGANNSQQAVFEIRNCVSANISGPWSITTKPQTGPIVNNPNAYISSYLCRAVPGGILNPSAGICAFFSVSDLTTIRTGNGIRVGEINNDAQTSEMQFINCKTPFTVNPVQIAGSQTLVSFVGCTLAANPVAGITNVINATLINDGGAVSIDGGSIEQHSDSTTQMILMGPCSSATYGNAYGQVAISGAVIETIAPICNISNRYGFTSPVSFNSKLSIVGCTGGYIGAVPSASGLVNVFDNNYAGAVSIPDGTLFYAQATSPARTGFNVNAAGNSKVRIAVGKTVFDTATGLKAYQAGVSGGIMVHPEVLATSAYVTSQSIPVNVQTTVIWQNNPADPVRTGRYQYILNTSNGVITLPNAGIKRVRIESTVVCGTGSGNILFVRNGGLYSYGTFAGGVGNVNVTIPDPVFGDTYSIIVSSSIAGTLDNLSKINIYFET